MLLTSKGGVGGGGGGGETSVFSLKNNSSVNLLVHEMWKL